MRSPFKFLDAFNLADKDSFFGREEEVAALHDMVLQNRLILVYGPSGTGKTSLVQCGLAARFDVTDWYPVYLRPHDIGDALRERLKMPNAEAAGLTIPEIVDELYVNNLRPVYLIFDQLEELFVLGSREEQEDFARTVLTVLQLSIPCRVLLIIREEYLAHLYPLEKTIPKLFDRRLRVETMSRSRIEGVIRRSFDTFHIRIPEPTAAYIEKMVDDLGSGRSGIQLPYLQVYLDRLYKSAANRQWPAEADKSSSWPDIILTSDDLHDLGKLDDVLEAYLEEQKVDIQQEVATQFKDAHPTLTTQVLDLLVSEEGTKRPVPCEKLPSGAKNWSKWVNALPHIPTDHLAACVDLLEKRRLVRFNDTHIELAHDALAAIIDRKRTHQQRRLHEVQQLLQAQFKSFGDTGEFLSRRQLLVMEGYLPLLEERLPPEIIQFVVNSQQDVLKKEEERLGEERQKRRRAVRLAVAGFALSLIAFTALGIALFQFNRAQKAQIARVLKAAEARKLEGEYREAISLLDVIVQGDYGRVSRSEQAHIDSLHRNWSNVSHLSAKGDSLYQLTEYRLALDLYNQANELDPDNRLREKAAHTLVELEQTFQRSLLQGEALCNAKKYDQALAAFDRALNLKPGNELALFKKQQCRLR